MVKAGQEVTYCSFQVKPPVDKSVYKYEITNVPFKYKYVRGYRPYSYIDFFQLLILIVTSRSTYIYYPGGLSVIAAKICMMLKKPYGVYVRGFGLFDPANDLKDFSDRTLDNSVILKKADYLTTVAPNIQQILTRYNANSSLIRPMLDWDRSHVYVSDANRFNPEKWIFLFVGSLTERKGISELIEIAGILKGKGVNFTLKIVGDGPLYNQLLKQQSEGDIIEEVELCGSMQDRNQLEKEYESANAFIFPTRSEGFPRVLYEAMLKSLPIFTTMVDGIPGIMKDRFNCIEIPVKDAAKQAEIIDRGINDIALLTTITENALSTALDALEQRKPHHQVLLDCIKRSQSR